MYSVKILCVIDSLGSGGAQKQMCNLACGLKAKGHDVEMLVYFPVYHFFRSEVDEAGIIVHEVEKQAGFSWRVVFRIRQLLRSRVYDAVISFLAMPNLYCELAKLLAFSRTLLIVSERSSAAGDKAWLKPKVFRMMHCFANYVVANSCSHAKWLRSHFWLHRKTRVIFNGYNLFPKIPKRQSSSEKRYSYLVIGRVNSVKNGRRLIEALALYVQRHGKAPSVAWTGRQELDSESLKIRKDMDILLAQHPEVAKNWHWLGERNDVSNLLQKCDALLHISLYEGLPNVICEAFIEQCPVIASNVCDHPLLVEEGVRGILCDPLSVVSICEAIERFESLSAQTRKSLGENARRYAEANLAIEKMVPAYEELITG